MTTLERILVYPIKSLDAASVSSAAVVDNGGLEWDRRYAIVDDRGNFVNGKREPQIHRLRSAFDLERETVTLWKYGGEGGGAQDDRRTFHLEDDRATLDSWLSTYFDRSVELVRDDEGGFPDDTDASGPTVLSTATLEAVASWFEGEIDVEGARRRFRANLEIDGVPAFWEDRLYDRPGRVVPFEIGDVEFHGVTPCQRCVVPTRDPDTGEPTEGFQERFLERREATLPSWANRAQFDHYFRLMVNTTVAKSSWGERLAVGDGLEVGEPIVDPA